MTTQELTLSQKTRIENILRALDQFPVSGDIANRRNSKRVNVHLDLNTFLLSVPSYPTITIHSRNISTSGIGFVSRRPFRKGEALAIELYLPDRIGKLILAQVTFSRYVRDGIYEIGCSFHDSISREEAMSRGKRVPEQWLAMSFAPPVEAPTAKPTPAATAATAAPAAAAPETKAAAAAAKN